MESKQTWINQNNQQLLSVHTHLAQSYMILFLKTKQPSHQTTIPKYLFGDVYRDIRVCNACLGQNFRKVLFSFQSR